jgi:hypothetical protein
MIPVGIYTSLLDFLLFLWSLLGCHARGLKQLGTWCSGSSIRRYAMQQLIDLRFETNAGLLQGGHFAALERPDELKADLVKFVDQVWPGIAGAK